MQPYLLPSLPLTPAVLRRLLPAITPRLDDRIDPNRFTPREVLAHLADWEPIMRGRIESALTQPGERIHAFDEGIRAFELDYGSWDARQSLDIFEQERQRTVRLIQSIRGEQWHQAVVHPERGVQSTYDLANLLIGHDLYHIEQLSAYLELKSTGTW